MGTTDTELSFQRFRTLAIVLKDFVEVQPGGPVFKSPLLDELNACIEEPRKLTLTKISRKIGLVQGVLIAKGLTTPQKEDARNARFLVNE